MGNIVQIFNSINNYRTKELYLPVSNQRAVVTPLTVGDDIELRTSATSPALITTQVDKIIYSHTQLYHESVFSNVAAEEQTEETTTTTKKKKKLPSKQDGLYKPEINEFFNSIAYIDRAVLIWGILNITYEYSGERELSCAECGEVFKHKIHFDDLLHEDSIVPYDKDVPFTEYYELYNTKCGQDHELEFQLRIPSIKNNHNLMSFITVDEIRENISKVGYEFSLPELIALYVKKIALYPKGKPENRTETQTLQEVLQMLRSLDISAGDGVLKAALVDLNSKYAVNFYEEVKCPHCGATIKYQVAPDVELFRTALQDREGSAS